VCCGYGHCGGRQQSDHVFLVLHLVGMDCCLIRRWVNRIQISRIH
jgi:hypothetical protein